MAAPPSLGATRELDQRTAAELGGCRSRVNALAWNVGGGKIAAASDDGSMRVWAVEGRNPSRQSTELKGAGQMLNLGWDPTNPNVLLGVGTANTAEFWDVRAAGRGMNVASVALPDAGVQTINVAWHPRGTDAVVGNHADKIAIIDVRTHKVARTEKFTYEVNELVYSGDGGTLFAGCTVGVMAFGNYPSLEVTHVVPTSFAYALARSRDGRTLAVGGYDANVQLIDAEDLAMRASITRLDEQVKSLSFSRDDALLASVASRERSIDVADTETGRHVATLVPPRAPSCVSFAPPGGAASSGSDVLAYAHDASAFLHRLGDAPAPSEPARPLAVPASFPGSHPLGAAPAFAPGAAAGLPLRVPLR